VLVVCLAMSGTAISVTASVISLDGDHLGSLSLSSNSLSRLAPRLAAGRADTEPGPHAVHVNGLIGDQPGWRTDLSVDKFHSMHAMTVIQLAWLEVVTRHCRGRAAVQRSASPGPAQDSLLRAA